MRVLVTGGAGYIGSHVVAALLDRNHEVTVVDNLSTGHRDSVPDRASFVAEDIRSTAHLIEIMRSARTEAVLHFAARSIIGEDARSPDLYYDTNVGGTISLLNAMAAASVGRIVVSSSCAVYGEPRAVPIGEDHPIAPVSVYGATKRVMEDCVQAWAGRHGWAWIALRYFNAAGAAPHRNLGERHDPETHLIPRAIRAALGSGPALAIFGGDYPTPDGTAIRDFIHVEDLAEAHVAALNAGESGAVNLGTGSGTSVREVLALVERFTGRAAPFTMGGRREGDPARLVATFGRAEKLLGWNPQRSIEHCIETAVQWERRE